MLQSQISNPPASCSPDADQLYDPALLSIRSAAEADAKELLAIYAPYVKNTAVSFEYEVPSVPAFQERIRHTLQKYPYLAAEYRGEIVGYIYAGPFHARAAFLHCAEASIYIRQDFHGLGIGRRLYEALEAKLCEMDIFNLYASIAVPDTEDEYLNKNSLRFHKKMGFLQVADFHHCGFKFGRWYNLVYVEKMLGSSKF